MDVDSNAGEPADNGDDMDIDDTSTSLPRDLDQHTEQPELDLSDTSNIPPTTSVGTAAAPSAAEDTLAAHVAERQQAKSAYVEVVEDKDDPDGTSSDSDESAQSDHSDDSADLLPEDDPDLVFGEVDADGLFMYQRVTELWERELCAHGLG